MALIKCPECGREVSNLAPTCIHCGYPLNEVQTDTQSQQVSTPVGKPNREPLTNKKKIIIAVCCIVVLLIGYFSLFHLGEDEQYAYDLLIANIGSFKNPKRVDVLSGTAGWMEEDHKPYAFVCITSANSYGAEVTGYYCLHPDGISDVSDESYMVKLCKEDDLNVGSINRRLAIYWLFH